MLIKVKNIVKNIGFDAFVFCNMVIFVCLFIHDGLLLEKQTDY